ncbi:hypothetical protein BJ165DRAFT_1519320 [Panaeolus papilionaceus]|nr:hypothetical protein BJ165DRAFT_1519320 [Panaeolus papilionaceus]
MSLFTPTRTAVVQEELAQCGGMDSVIQYDDVRGYFDQVELPTPAYMPRKTTNPHDMSLSSRVSGTTMPLPMAPIVGSPTSNALPPPIPSPPAMNSLTPPIPLHHEKQTGLSSHHHYCQSSGSSGYNRQQWHPLAMGGPNSSLSPTPTPIQQHQPPQQSSSSSSQHHRQLSSSSSLSRRRNGQPIASGSNSNTHIIPHAPFPGPSRTVRHKQSKSRSDVQQSRDSQSRGGVQHSTRTRGEGSTAHTRKRSTSGGIRIVTIYDVRGFEGVEPDPRFPNMMVVDRTGGEPMVVYRSGDVSGVGYGMYGAHGGTGNHDQSLRR